MQNGELPLFHFAFFILGFAFLLPLRAPRLYVELGFLTSSIIHHPHNPMSIRLERPGLLTTVQDLGRWGWQRYGVVVSGPMDRRSCQIANLLVGNTPSAAVLEMTLQGPRLFVERESLVAMTGAEMTATINDRFLPMGKPFHVAANSVLDCGTATEGCRAYLAVAGGFNVPVTLDSRSTNLAAELGGLSGRALQSGDILETGEVHLVTQRAMDRLLPTPSWGAASRLPSRDRTNVIRAITGSEFESLPNEYQRGLFEFEFAITSKSDRMGYRLSGPSFGSETNTEIVSEGVAMGTVQLPPDGQLIVLMADCATTGGYPKIAHVVSSDQPLLAQCVPGTKLRFQRITLETAHHLYRADEADMNKLRMGVALKFVEL